MWLISYLPVNGGSLGSFFLFIMLPHVHRSDSNLLLFSSDVTSNECNDIKVQYLYDTSNV